MTPRPPKNDHFGYHSVLFFVFSVPGRGRLSLMKRSENKSKTGTGKSLPIFVFWDVKNINSSSLHHACRIPTACQPPAPPAPPDGGLPPRRWGPRDVRAARRGGRAPRLGLPGRPVQRDGGGPAVPEGPTAAAARRRGCRPGPGWGERGRTTRGGGDLESRAQSEPHSFALCAFFALFPPFAYLMCYIYTSTYVHIMYIYICVCTYMYQILICVFYPAPWVKDTVPGDKAQYFRDGQSPKYPVGGGGVIPLPYPPGLPVFGGTDFQSIFLWRLRCQKIFSCIVLW